MPASTRKRDEGFTLVELLVVAVVLGLITVVISAALVAVLRISPSTQYRIDDARSVRALQTWLVRDAASTPPRVMTSSADLDIGGYIFSDGATGWLPAGDQCGVGAGNILHMTWNEGSVRYNANYRIDAGRVVRTYCQSGGGTVSTLRLAGDVSTSFCSSAGFSSVYSYGTAGAGVDVKSVEMCVRSVSLDSGLNQGERETADIRLSVSSRNLVEVP